MMMEDDDLEGWGYDDDDGGGSSSRSSSSCWLERTTLSWGNPVPAAPSHPDPAAHAGVLGCSKARALRGNGTC